MRKSTRRQSEILVHPTKKPFPHTPGYPAVTFSIDYNSTVHYNENGRDIGFLEEIRIWFAEGEGS